MDELSLDELSGVVGRITGLLLTEETVSHAVEQLARATRDAIEPSMGAGVSLLDPRGVRVSAGATDRVVEQADALQYELGEGPCLSAWASGATVRMDDAATERRWPRWITAVAPLQVASTLSAPLLVKGAGCIGALKVYSTQPAAFDRHAQDLLQSLAAPAAALLAHIQTSETPHRSGAELGQALRSRDLIAQAKGVLLERHGLEEDEAMAALVRAARREGISLRVLAERIVHQRARIEL